MITQERLKELLEYDPETGIFTRRVSIQGGGKAGSEAGSLRSDGYVFIGIDRKMHLGHRLAWLYVHGCMPKEIDHINRVRDDNRLANLRLATRGQNMQNQNKRSDNTSGHPGVHLHRASQKWQARIKLNGRDIHLGYFDSLDDTIAARKAAEKKYFGDFAPA